MHFKMISIKLFAVTAAVILLVSSVKESTIYPDMPPDRIGEIVKVLHVSRGSLGLYGLFPVGADLAHMTTDGRPPGFYRQVSQISIDFTASPFIVLEGKVTNASPSESQKGNDLMLSDVRASTTTLSEALKMNPALEDLIKQARDRRYEKYGTPDPRYCSSGIPDYPLKVDLEDILSWMGTFHPYVKSECISILASYYATNPEAFRGKEAEIRDLLARIPPMGSSDEKLGRALFHSRFLQQPGYAYQLVESALQDLEWGPGGNETTGGHLFRVYDLILPLLGKQDPPSQRYVLIAAGLVEYMARRPPFYFAPLEPCGYIGLKINEDALRLHWRFLLPDSYRDPPQAMWRLTMTATDWDINGNIAAKGCIRGAVGWLPGRGFPEEMPLNGLPADLAIANFSYEAVALDLKAEAVESDHKASMPARLKNEGRINIPPRTILLWRTKVVSESSLDLKRGSPKLYLNLKSGNHQWTVAIPIDVEFVS